jgi:hypothetical protein
MIGVPVACTPGLVPQAELLTVAALLAAGADVDVLEPELGLELELELHPARTPPTARTEARTAPSRHLRREDLCIIDCLLVATSVRRFEMVRAASLGRAITQRRAHMTRARGETVPH